MDQLGIFKKGENKMKEPFVIECPKCGLSFEAAGDTVGFNNDSIIFGTITCPECNYEQDLSDDYS